MSSSTDPPPASLIPSLPDDVAVNCLARIPRCYHPTLALVSKPFRSRLSSADLFATRTFVNSTQNFLYVCLRSGCSVQFFTLTENPQSPSNPNRLLIPVPLVPSPSIGSAYAVVGPKIYVLGGSVNDVPSRNVWIFDCRFNRWEIGPRMRVGREFAAAGVVYGKIYVMGGCVVDTWARAVNWAEVFDPVVGEWEAVSSPAEVREKWMHASAVADGKVYAMADRGGVVYDPKTMTWDSVTSHLDLGWRGRASVVDGVLYCYDYLGKVRGFDVKEGVWKELRGMEKWLPKFLCGATMANVGGNLVVVWEVKGSGKKMEIWCAEIEIVKSIKGELWGKICWTESVLAVPNGSAIIHCLAVTF